MGRIANCKSPMVNCKLSARGVRVFSAEVCNSPRRRGFTLIELLLVMVIIGMIVGLSLGALRKAQEAARIAQTKSTIVKIHDIIMRKYESYKDRRIKIYIPPSMLPPTTSTPPGPRQMAAARLNLLRDTMRMEMPDRWSDVCANPLNPTTKSSSGTVYAQVVINAATLAATPTPALSQRYYNTYNLAFSRAGATTVANNASAKCLFMIVMNTAGAAESFQQQEIADLDGDGLRVFIDGWGNPIKFVRWPAGFVNDPTNSNYGNGDLQTGNPLTDPDPFDPQKVFVPTALAASGYYNRGYALFPLVFSPGPDGQYDINLGGAANGFTYTYGGTWAGDGCLDPYVTDGNLRLVGCPVNGPLSGTAASLPNSPTSDPARQVGVLRHWDNIHNHHLDVR